MRWMDNKKACADGDGSGCADDIIVTIFLIVHRSTTPTLQSSIKNEIIVGGSAVDVAIGPRICCFDFVRFNVSFSICLSRWVSFARTAEKGDSAAVA